MKRKELLKILNNNGCILLRNGSKHDIYHNPNKGTTQPIPRHNEILAKKIIRDLNLDSKKLRITSGFKNKLETLIHRIHNSAILYEKLSNQKDTFAF